MNFELKRISDTEYDGVKAFEFADLKVEADSDVFYISGYVNTKNKPDAYGDIPTNFNGNAVYDLGRYQKNPVLLVDHNNSAGWTAGIAVDIQEDEKGLLAKFKLMQSPVNPTVQHAIQALKEGILRGFSIGGRWSFEDAQNPTHLTKAAIAEISLVAVGADPRALARSVGSKSISGEANEAKAAEFAAYLVGIYRETQDEQALKTLNEFKKIRGKKNGNIG